MNTLLCKVITLQMCFSRLGKCTRLTLPRCSLLTGFCYQPLEKLLLTSTRSWHLTVSKSWTWLPCSWLNSRTPCSSILSGTWPLLSLTGKDCAGTCPLSSWTAFYRWLPSMISSKLFSQLTLLWPSSRPSQTLIKWLPRTWWTCT